MWSGELSLFSTSSRTCINSNFAVPFKPLFGVISPHLDKLTDEFLSVNNLQLGYGMLRKGSGDLKDVIDQAVQSADFGGKLDLYKYS